MSKQTTISNQNLTDQEISDHIAFSQGYSKLEQDLASRLNNLLTHKTSQQQIIDELQQVIDGKSSK